MTLYLEAFFDLVQELFPAQEDELPPAKMPKFAVQADDAARPKGVRVVGRRAGVTCSFHYYLILQAYRTGT